MTRLVTFKEQSLADCSNSLGIKILITINLRYNMERSPVQDLYKAAFTLSNRRFLICVDGAILVWFGIHMIAQPQRRQY